MPTYEYECPKCGKIIERFRHMNARKKIVTCDKCKCSCKMLIGPGSGIIFRGPGFYVNDYKKDNKSRRSQVEGHRSKQEEK